MSNNGRVISVNISAQTGTIKKPVTELVIDEKGIIGDAHSGQWHRQVSLLSKEDIYRFSKNIGRKIAPGEFAENITTSDIDLEQVAVLDILRIGQVELQITQIGKECHDETCAIFQEVGKCIMPKKGIFCTVLKQGKIKAGDTIEYLPKKLRFLIITLSDRAFTGQYTDRSGPRAKQILMEHFACKRWHCEFDYIVLADDAARLREELNQAISNDADVIFTIGGTGVGPRDITPETVMAISDKLIPGIMENIRIKYGNDKPSVLLSRSVAAISGKTQLYTLPGGVRAVEEYLTEILKTLEHTIFMMHGLDIH